MAGDPAKEMENRKWSVRSVDDWYSTDSSGSDSDDNSVLDGILSLNDTCQTNIVNSHDDALFLNTDEDGFESSGLGPSPECCICYSCCRQQCPSSLPARYAADSRTCSGSTRSESVLNTAARKKKRRQGATEKTDEKSRYDNSFSFPHVCNRCLAVAATLEGPGPPHLKRTRCPSMQPKQETNYPLNDSSFSHFSASSVNVDQSCVDSCTVDDCYVLSGSEDELEEERSCLNVLKPGLSIHGGALDSCIPRLVDIESVLASRDSCAPPPPASTSPSPSAQEATRRGWGGRWMWNAVVSIFMTAAGVFFSGGVKVKIGGRFPSVYQRDRLPRLRRPGPGEPQYKIRYTVGIDGHLVMQRVPVYPPAREENHLIGGGKQTSLGRNAAAAANDEVRIWVMDGDDGGIDQKHDFLRID